MEQMGERLGQNDPAAAEALRDAVQSSRQAGTSELMQKAASNVQQNQVGAAESAQRQAAEDLKEMLNTLEDNRERDLAKIVEKLKAAEAKLADLRSRQAEQLQRTKDAQSKQSAEERRRELERLARHEKELQQETARLAQQLKRLRAEQAGKTSSSASNRMGQAGQQLQQGDGDEAQAEQQKVLEDLEKAQQEVAQARREAEAQLAMEQLAKIADTLVSLHARQKTLKEETVRLDQARQEKGNWTRPQLASLRAAGETQGVVRSDTDKAREVLTSAPVFALTLTRAISNMERAIDLLNERRADTETQTAQQAAIDRFAQLLDSLKNEPSDQQGDEQSGGGQGGGQQGGPPRDGIPPLAQLKMLKSLQIEINDRTRELGEVRASEKKLSPAQERELQSLGAEQGTLADLVRSLTEPPGEGENP
jgi:DNA repair exonuclease SbcCD ATPase subunit